jgi:hypothetical protein
MITYRQALSDSVSMLKQVYGENAVQPSNVLYWITIVVNTLRAQFIEKRAVTGGISGENIKVFTDIPVLTLPVTAGDQIKGRKHILLPINILNLERDDGINYVSYYHNEEAALGQASNTMTRFTRTTVGKLWRLYESNMEKPSPKNPYFYRIGDVVYLMGIEQILSPHIEIGLVFSVDFISINSLDDTINLPDHLLATLTFKVYEFGVFALKIPANDKNDGMFKIKGLEEFDQKPIKADDSQQ